MVKKVQCTFGSYITYISSSYSSSKQFMQKQTCTLLVSKEPQQPLFHKLLLVPDNILLASYKAVMSLIENFNKQNGLTMPVYKQTEKSFVH